MNTRVIVNGSCWQESAEDAPIACGLPNQGGLLNDVTGFRIVFDNAEQRDRGGSWRYAKNLAFLPSGAGSNPTARVMILGFRLARENT